MVRYNMFGTGNVPILALHNWFCDASSYAPLLPYLDPKKFSFLLMDVRGYGVAKEVKGSYNLQEILSDILGLTEALHWKQFHVVGHAMGSLIGQKLAIEHPNKVKSLVAIAPISTGAGPKTEQLIDFLETAAIHSDANALECIHALSNRRYTDYTAKKMLQHWRAISTSEARLSYLHMLSNAKLSQPAQPLKTPILAVFGEHDVDNEEAKFNQNFLKWYPNAQFEHCKSIGHFSIQEAPIYMASLIERFTDKHPIEPKDQKQPS